MNRENEKYWYRGISNIFILLLLTTEYGYIWYTKLNILSQVPFMGKGNYLMYGVYLIISVFVIYTFDGFKMGVNRISHIIISQWLSMAVVNVITIVEAELVIGNMHMTISIIEAFIELAFLQAITILFVTYILTKLYRSIFPPLHMLMIYGDYANSLAVKMNSRKDKYIIADEIYCGEPLEKIVEKMRDYDAILLNDIDNAVKNCIIKECYDQKKRMYFTPKIHDILVKNADELHLFDTPIYLCRNLGMTVTQKFFKRLGDIVISFVGIVLTSPIMIIAAIAIKCYDRGPVFYKQTRLTIDDKPFEIMKFRSMIVDAEKDGKARLSSENDSRITPIGKFIRATRIDELPQFFNVFKGEMSMVGPRPERPEIVAEYVEEIPEFAYRTRVKAGLTGYAQVYGKYNTTNLDKLKLDMIYVERGSILLDLKLILLTFKVVFIKDATEGIEEGETTASAGNFKNE